MVSHSASTGTNEVSSSLHWTALRMCVALGFVEVKFGLLRAPPMSRGGLLLLLLYLTAGQGCEAALPEPPMGHVGRARLGLFYAIVTGSSVGYRNLSNKSRPRGCFCERFHLCPPHGLLEGSISR